MAESIQNAWDLSRSTATGLLTFPKEQGGLQVKLPMGTLFHATWGNLHRCSQFDDGTRQMMEFAYREALDTNCCHNLTELQDEAGLLSWNQAIKKEFAFACHLAKTSGIEVT